MSDKRKEIIKKSILVGALTSSFGVFVSKILGLLYYSPLCALAGEGNMAFYSITYTYYDVLLNISQAGIPFAITTLVSSYVVRKDYRSALLVKRVGTAFVLLLSVVCCVGFAIFSGPLARKALGSLASDADIKSLRILFTILLFAVIFVPFLSAIRGYFQGLKRMDLYASSQVFEQFIRVTSILLLGYIAVVVLKLNNMYAIYCAIAAASIAAVASIIFVFVLGRKDDKELKYNASNQSGDIVSPKDVIKEIIRIGIPYVLISFFGTAGPIINTTFFIDYVTKCGTLTQSEAVLSLGILQANCSKLNAIPQVLSVGFCAGLVPYLNESLEKQDFSKLSKQVVQINDTLFFFLVPMLFIFLFFGRDIYYIMYGSQNLTLGTDLLRKSVITSLTETVLPVFTSIVISLRLRKESVFTLIAGFIIKAIAFFPLVKAFGTLGIILSTAIVSVCCMTIYLLLLKKRYNISFIPSVKRIVIIAINSAITVIPCFFLRTFVVFAYNSRLLCFLFLFAFGVIMLLIYLTLSKKTKLFKDIFDIDDVSFKTLFKRFRV